MEDENKVKITNLTIYIDKDYDYKSCLSLELETIIKEAIKNNQKSVLVDKDLYDKMMYKYNNKSTASITNIIGNTLLILGIISSILVVFVVFNPSIMGLVYGIMVFLPSLFMKAVCSALSRIIKNTAQIN